MDDLFTFPPIPDGHTVGTIIYRVGSQLKMYFDNTYLSALNVKYKKNLLKIKRISFFNKVQNKQGWQHP